MGWGGGKKRVTDRNQLVIAPYTCIDLGRPRRPKGSEDLQAAQVLKSLQAKVMKVLEGEWECQILIKSRGVGGSAWFLISFLFLHLLAPLSILTPFYIVRQPKVTFSQPTSTGHLPFYSSHWVFPFVLNEPHRRLELCLTLGYTDKCVFLRVPASLFLSPLSPSLLGGFLPAHSRCHSFIQWNA